MNQQADLAIVGAGIVGLAHAYHALQKGKKVVLFERESFAVGASVRNFGMVWPIGQAAGEGLELAMASRRIWNEIAAEAGIWINPNGSLHLAYHQDEWDVLNEFVAAGNGQYDCQLLTVEETLARCPSVNKKELKGAMWSSTECIVNPREAIRRIPLWLQEKFGLILRFENQVQEIALPKVRTSKETWSVEKVIVCNGADFQTLYPQEFEKQPITKCKLQMMKARFTGNNLQVGPSLCAGLTLRHYSAFANCPSLSKMDERYDQENIAFKEHGIHVLLSQNNYGELIIGDSHHYGNTLEPFDTEAINQVILNYFHTFFQSRDIEITERWHGVYPKIKGQLNLVLHPEKDVMIVNGLGGAGMTLSFGLAEKIIAGLY